MKEKNATNETTPFLKWAGGKQWLVPCLKPLLNSISGKYIEPFLGGGSVFLCIRPRNAWLSDWNRELVDTYLAIKSDSETVIRQLQRFSFTKECYERVRKSKPRSAAGKAARLIYLNRTCWNGLYRVNRRGDFNVPMGSFDSGPNFVVADRLKAAQKALRGVRISCQDFEKACKNAAAGDTVYLDPPYTVVHKNNGFLRYNERVFSWEDQVRLAKLAKSLKEKGCKVIVSNADHGSIKKLYGEFYITKVGRKSLVAGEISKRCPITELLITSFAP